MGSQALKFDPTVMPQIRGAMDLLQSYYGVRLRPRSSPLNDTIPVAATRMLLEEPARVKYALQNLGAVNILVWYDGSISAANRAIIVPPGALFTWHILQFDFRVTGEFWMMAPGGPCAYVGDEQLLL